MNSSRHSGVCGAEARAGCKRHWERAGRMALLRPHLALLLASGGVRVDRRRLALRHAHRLSHPGFIAIGGTIPERIHSTEAVRAEAPMKGTVLDVGLPPVCSKLDRAAPVVNPSSGRTAGGRGVGTTAEIGNCAPGSAFFRRPSANKTNETHQLSASPPQRWTRRCGRGPEPVLHQHRCLNGSSIGGNRDGKRL